MFEPVKVVIGGTEYAVPTELNFVALKRCQPILTKLGAGAVSDPIDMAELAIEVIAAAFAESDPAKTVEFFTPRLKAHEVMAVAGCITPIMVASGFWKKTETGAPKSGEDQPAAETPTST